MKILKKLVPFVWIFAISLLGAWAQFSITPLARRGAEKAWPDCAFPRGFHLLLDNGWILYLLPIIVLVQWVASFRLPSLANEIAVSLTVSIIALLFLCYGLLLSMPLISIGVYAK
jgi:signal transduction histidine kinase